MKPSVRNPPRNRGYFSSSPQAFSIKKYDLSRPILHSNIHQVLHLPRKVRLQVSLFVGGAVLGEVQVSLFVAGAILGEVQVLLFVAGAALGDVQVSLCVAGAALGKCLNVRLGAKHCIFQ